MGWLVKSLQTQGLSQLYIIEYVVLASYIHNVRSPYQCLSNACRTAAEAWHSCYEKLEHNSPDRPYISFAGTPSSPRHMPCGHMNEALGSRVPASENEALTAKS